MRQLERFSIQVAKVDWFDDLQEEWPEGITMAAKINFKWSHVVKSDLHKLIPNANADGIALIEAMLSWDPKKRPNAAQVHLGTLLSLSIDLS